jgi:hypothetical protein
VEPRDAGIVKNKIAGFGAADRKRTISGQFKNLGWAFRVVYDESRHVQCSI